MQEKIEGNMPPQEHEEVETRELPSGEWLEVSPDMEYLRPSSGEVERMKLVVDEADKMTYTCNNGVIAFVDGEGRMRVGPATLDSFKTLEESGYKHGSLFVPFSNGELSLDQKFRTEWKDMREEATKQNIQRRTERHLGYYQEQAKEKEITEVAGRWLDVDGAEIGSMGNEKSSIGRNTDGYNMAVGRLEHVGTFDANNGVIAFVDGEGRMHAGPATPDRFGALEEAGYTRGIMFVPFSNGDLPLDPALRAEWESMVEER